MEGKIEFSKEDPKVYEKFNKILEILINSEYQCKVLADECAIILEYGWKESTGFSEVSLKWISED